MPEARWIRKAKYAVSGAETGFVKWTGDIESRNNARKSILEIVIGLPLDDHADWTAVAGEAFTRLRAIFPEARVSVCPDDVSIG